MPAITTVKIDKASSQQKADIIAEQEKQTESALDEALEESFPASDPVAINVEK